MNNQNDESKQTESEDSMAGVASYVSRKMRDSGSCAPEIIMSGVGGLSRLAAENLPAGWDKDKFSEMARAACVATGARAVMFASEVWFKQAKAGEFLDLAKAPSQYPDRQEAVIMFWQTRSSFEQRVLPIERTAAGKFQRLGGPLEINVARFTGCFANLLPVEYPSSWDRGLAATALALQGVKIENLNEAQRRKMLEESAGKFYVISPDNISITPEPFPSKKAAMDFIPKWCAQYREQGYYSCGGERIPLDELPACLHLESEAEMIRAERAGDEEDRREERSGHFMGM